MENMELKPITVRDIVEQVISDLGKIALTADQVETVGLPIARSINNLKEVCKAWDAADAENEREEGAPNE